MSRYHDVAARFATGEMEEVVPEEWPIHKEVADMLGGELKPFDQYQGPFIALDGRKIFLGPPEEMWQVLILGQGWVGGIDSRERAEQQAKDAMEQRGVEHNISDLVQSDDVQNYIMATDTVSRISTPAYPYAATVSRELADAIVRNILHPQGLHRLEEQWSQPSVEPRRDS